MEYGVLAAASCFASYPTFLPGRRLRGTAPATGAKTDEINWPQLATAGGVVSRSLAWGKRLRLPTTFEGSENTVERFLTSRTSYILL